MKTFVVAGLFGLGCMTACSSSPAHVAVTQGPEASITSVSSQAADTPSNTPSAASPGGSEGLTPSTFAETVRQQGIRLSLTDDMIVQLGQWVCQLARNGTDQPDLENQTMNSGLTQDQAKLFINDSLVAFCSEIVGRVPPSYSMGN